MKNLLFVLCLLSFNAFSKSAVKIDTVPILVPFVNYALWVSADTMPDTSTMCAAMGGHVFLYSQKDTVRTNYIADSLPYLSTIVYKRICQMCFYEEKQIYTFGTSFVNEEVNYANIKKKKKRRIRMN